MRDERASTLARARLLPREPLTHLPTDYDPGVDPSPAARRKRGEGDTSRDRGAAAFAVRNSHDLVPLVASQFAATSPLSASAMVRSCRRLRRWIAISALRLSSAVNIK